MSKQIRALQLAVKRIRSQEDNTARQELITRGIFTLASIGVALISAVVFGLLLTNQADLGSVVLTLVVDMAVLLGWFFLARGRWQISALCLPLLSLAVAGYMVYTVGPVTTGVLQLVLAVILAGMLSGNRARWITVGLACLVYVGAGLASGSLDLTTFLTSGSLLLVTLVTVALLERFFTDQLDQSQAMVREREGELESIFRAAPVGIGMVVDRTITEANPTLCQMTGYTREELVGNSARLLYPTQEEFEYVGLEKYRQIRQHNRGTVETRWRRKDGELRDILLSSVPLEANDLSRGVTFSALDVTERKRAAQALYESEERYRQTVENSPNPIFSIDRQGRIRLWNRACEKTFQYNQNILGQPYHILLPGEKDRARVQGMLKNLDCGQSLSNIDMVFLCENGLERFMVSRIYPFCDQHKEVLGYVFANTDITERKLAEAEVLKSKQALEEAERLVHLGHYEIDIQTGKAVWSDEIFNIFGLDRAQGTPTVESYQDLVHPADRQAVEKLYAESLQKRTPFDLVYRIVRTAGDVRYVRSYADLVEDAAGKQKLFGTLQDITKLKQVELALQESQSLYHDLVETAQDLIWQCDREGRFLYLNPAWADLLGYALHEMVGQPFTAFLPPDYASRDRDTFLHLLDGNSISRYETIYLAKDGSPLHLVFNAKAIRDHQGNVVGARGTAYDITQRKQAESALQESAARYQAVVENQTEFIVRWRPDGRRTFVNEAYLRYFHLTMEEALSTGFLPLVTEDDRRAVAEKVSRLVSGHITSETDIHRVIKPDGSTGWQEWTDHAIYNERGELIEFQSIGRDVTERILAEQALRTKTEELEALFSISSHLRTAQSADAMLPVVLEEMRRVLRSDANAVILIDPDHEHFTYALGDGSLAVNDGLQFPVENSISGLVLKTGQAYLAEDLSSDPRKASGVKGDEDLGAAVVVPVVSESQFLGVLLCARRKSNDSQQFSASEVRLLVAVGEMVGNALRRARLYDQALKRMQQLQTLHSIDTAISANLDLGVILDVLLTQGLAQLDADAACVLLLNPQTHMLEFSAGKGFRARELRFTRLRLGEGLAGKVALERRILHAADLSRYAEFQGKDLLDEGFVACQAAPLIAKGQLQGVLQVFNREAVVVDEERTEFLETLATQAAIAVDNSQLFSDLQRTNFELEMAYDATIEGWSRALELRDMETEGHTLRVTDMTVQLAQELGVPSGELIHIRRGALLHDIGKMGVPDRILLKPGKLDQEEWEVMKRHTVYARDMLWPIQFLRPAIDIPYCHHERWDGSGYPRQLQGEQIPLSARLFAVADVWDALTSDRPYRQAWTEDKALAYIARSAGKHFDPQVVELFLLLYSRRKIEF